VNDIVNLWMRLENLVQSGLVGNVDVVDLWLLAADELNAVCDLFERVVKVVHDDDVVASLNEGEGCERANVTGTTGQVLVVCLHSGVCERSLVPETTIAADVASSRRKNIRDMHLPGNKNRSNSHFGGCCEIIVNGWGERAQVVEEKVKAREERA